MMAVARRVPGKQNQTEARYDRELAMLLRAGEIVWYGFEALTFRLADDTRYTPDFIVIDSAGAVTAREIKGFWRDDAKVKIKVAATLFPWIAFWAIQADGKGWRLTEFVASETPRAGAA